MFYLYSGVIPIAIIILVLWFNRPLSFQRVVTALTKTLIYLFIYILLVYYLDSEHWIDSSWAIPTLFFFFAPYLVVVLILNGVAWSKRRKAKA